MGAAVGTGALALALVSAAVLATPACAAPQAATRETTIADRCPRPAPPPETGFARLLAAHQLIEREAGQAYARDPAIQDGVIAALRGQGVLRRSAIDVETRRRMVTLSGCVETRRAARTAVAVTRRTAGVERVFDELRLAPARERAGTARGASP